jgi:MarR family transcriptional regulator, organic hydroperoxide resistance regulator
MSETAEASPAGSATTEMRDDVTEAWRLVRELMIASRPHYLAVLQDVGLSPVQGMALLHLQADEPLTMSALAAALKCDNSNVTGIVDRLEAAGLVERRPAPHDRRVKTVAVTAHGARLRDEAERRMSVPPPAFARLGAEDARTLRAVLERLAAS